MIEYTVGDRLTLTLSGRIDTNNATECGEEIILYWDDRKRRKSGLERLCSIGEDVF